MRWTRLTLFSCENLPSSRCVCRELLRTQTAGAFLPSVAPPISRNQVSHLAVSQWQLKLVQTVATTLSRMNFCGCIAHVTIFRWMLTIACCLVVRLGTLVFDLVSGWLVATHTYLYYYRFSLSHCRYISPTKKVPEANTCLTPRHLAQNIRIL